MTKIHGPRIKAARGYAGGISTAELGKRIGVSESTVKRWEGGDTSLTIGYRVAIAAACGVPADFMERGWSVLEPNQIAELLAEQSDLLREIKAAVASERKIRDEIADLIGQSRREFLDPPKDEPDPQPDPAPPVDDAKKKAAKPQPR